VTNQKYDPGDYQSLGIGPEQYDEHGVDPVSNPVDKNIRTTGEDIRKTRPELATPEARQKFERERMETHREQIEKAVREGRIKTFDPLQGDGELYFFRNNRAEGIHISRVDAFIPGVMDPDNPEGPFLVIEMEQLRKVSEIRRLLRTKINPKDPDDERMVLEQITEEQYLIEHVEWLENSAKRSVQKEKELMGPYDADPENNQDFNINWDIPVHKGVRLT
jgi:hypothetical protein